MTSSLENLVAKTQNKVVMVCFSQTREDIYWDTFVKQLRAVVTPIRNDMLKKVNHFEGSFDEDSQMKSIPIRLLTLINLLIDGTCEGGNHVRQAALTCSNYYVL